MKKTLIISLLVFSFADTTIKAAALVIFVDTIFNGE